MGNALLRRHDMGDYLQRLYLTPDSHSAASRNGRSLVVDGPRVQSGGPAVVPADPGPDLAGAEPDHLDFQPAMQKLAD